MMLKWKAFNFKRQCELSLMLASSAYVDNFICVCNGAISSKLSYSFLATSLASEKSKVYVNFAQIR